VTKVFSVREAVDWNGRETHRVQGALPGASDPVHLMHDEELVSLPNKICPFETKKKLKKKTQTGFPIP
jgi:hypothetical protein